jgi:hypothetical protein
MNYRLNNFIDAYFLLIRFGIPANRAREIAERTTDMGNIAFYIGLRRIGTPHAEAFGRLYTGAGRDVRDVLRSVQHHPNKLQRMNMYFNLRRQGHSHRNSKLTVS